MKKNAYLSILMLLTILISASAYAGENLADWEKYIWQGNISMSHPGTELSITANGNNQEALGRIYKKFDNAVGMFAEVNVSRSSGENGVGIRQNVGLAPDGNKIMAEVYVNDYNGNKRFQYKIRKGTGMVIPLKYMHGAIWEIFRMPGGPGRMY